MKVVFRDVCSREGIRNLNLELDLSRINLLYDPSEKLSTAICNALMGLDEVLEGSILLDGIPLHEVFENEPQIRSFAYVFDEGIMLSNLSLRENLMLPLRWLNPHLNEAETDVMINSWMRTFGLALDLDQRPVVYRPGDLKLLSYVRALLIAPKLLIIDDPYYLLNKREREKLYRVLHSLKSSFPMLIASIDDDFGKPFADELIDLSNRQNNFAGIASLS